VVINLKYKPHKHQQKLHNDKHRYLVVVAGRRFGKSVFARNHVILNAIYNPGLYWIINPTYRQGKAIHWLDLKKEIPHELVLSKNEQELSVQLKNGSRIEIKGADNEDALRGVGLKGVVMDEAADQKPHVWEEIIRPTLVDSKGWGVFIGTPKGFNWFYELYKKGKRGDSNRDLDWKSYQFTSYDNPFLEKKEIDKAREETDEDTFAQEYLAQFKKFKGLIYKSFSDTHIIKPFDIPNDGTYKIFRGIDFGYGVNPTVCLWIAVDKDDRWYVIDEYYEIKDTDDYHTGMILAASGKYPSTIMSYADPSNPQKIEAWSKMGVYLTAATRVGNTNLSQWVANGIDLIKEKLKLSPIDKKPYLYVFNTCDNLIDEFKKYRYKKQPGDGLNNTIRPEKADDHGLDALRYFAISYVKGLGMSDYTAYVQKIKENKDQELGF